MRRSVPPWGGQRRHDRLAGGFAGRIQDHQVGAADALCDQCGCTEAGAPRAGGARPRCARRRRRPGGRARRRASPSGRRPGPGARRTARPRRRVDHESPAPARIGPAPPRPARRPRRHAPARRRRRDPVALPRTIASTSPGCRRSWPFTDDSGGAARAAAARRGRGGAVHVDDRLTGCRPVPTWISPAPGQGAVSAGVPTTCGRRPGTGRGPRSRGNGGRKPAAPRGSTATRTRLRQAKPFAGPCNRLYHAWMLEARHQAQLLGHPERLKAPRPPTRHAESRSRRSDPARHGTRGRTRSKGGRGISHVPARRKDPVDAVTGRGPGRRGGVAAETTPPSAAVQHSRRRRPASCLQLEHLMTTRKWV